jgi:hypothetical protein
MKNRRSIDNIAPSLPSHGDKKLLVILSSLVVLVVIDISLVRVYDIISKQVIPLDTKELFFGIISIACLVAEYLLLETITPLGDESKNKLHVRIIYKVTKATQYVIGAILVLLIFQIFSYSFYNTVILLTIISFSYILGIAILTIFITRILTVLPFKWNTIYTIIFVFALGFITINAAITMLDVFLRLGDRPDETRAFFAASSDSSKGRYNIIDFSYFISYILSFVTAWIATVILLSNYSHKLGKIKYMLITVSPMVFFVGQFIAFYTNEISSIFNIDQFFLASLTTLLTTLSKPFGGLMLAIGFWSMAKVGKGNTTLNRYLIISGFGFFLLFTSNQALLMSIAPYPPFGIATITIIGLSAYLVIIGIYMSTISLSQDAELRRSIRRVARAQSKLFDSMVTAEIEKEIEKKVMEVIKIQSFEMENETGVQPSLNDPEIQDYLKQVIREIKR